MQGLILDILMDKPPLTCAYHNNSGIYNFQQQTHIPAYNWRLNLSNHKELKDMIHCTVIPVNLETKVYCDARL
jgi:hypothetical protein